MLSNNNNLEKIIADIKKYNTNFVINEKYAKLIIEIAYIKGKISSLYKITVIENKESN